MHDHHHDHFSGFKDPSMWAFAVGMFGSIGLIAYAESRAWIPDVLDTFVESFIGLAVGALFSGLVLLLQDRLRKKAAPAPVHHHHHHDHDCEHDHSH